MNSYLFYFIFHRNNASILGANNENVPKILGIIGDVISEEVLVDNDLVQQRLLAIVRHVQVGVTVIIEGSKGLMLVIYG